MLPLSQPLRELLLEYLSYLDRKAAEAAAPTIQVDEVASQIAVFYEKIRNLIDYRENHLLRKHAIDRAFRRRVFLKDLSGEDIAEPLIREVIRSGRLGNDTVPETKIQEVSEFIQGPIALLGELSRRADADELSEWLTGITVAAIEDILAPPATDELLATGMLQTLSEGLTIRGADIREKDCRTLLFIAIEKSLLNVYAEQLECRLLTFLYPDWKRRGENVLETLSELERTKMMISACIRHPLLPHFLKFCNRKAFVFRLLGDLVFGGKDFENFEAEVKEAYDTRMEREKKRLSKLAAFSVISFFLSKVLVALAIEVPIEFRFRLFSLPHTIAGVLFPPLLMFIVVASIRGPSKKNFRLVIGALKAVVYTAERKTYEIIVPKAKRRLTSLLVKFSYTAVFALSLFVVARLLLRLGFGIPSICVFILFTSLVTATGVKIANRAKEMSLEKQRSGFLRFLLDLFTVPLTAIGRVALAGLKRFNVLVILLNLLVELPIQLFVEFLEHFNDFMRRKKEEID